MFFNLILLFNIKLAFTTMQENTQFEVFFKEIDVFGRNIYPICNLGKDYNLVLIVDYRFNNAVIF